MTREIKFKYPKINSEKMDSINRQRFDSLYKTLIESITFDNKENQLKLTKGDIEIIAWNASVNIIFKPY